MTGPPPLEPAASADLRALCDPRPAASSSELQPCGDLLQHAIDAKLLGLLAHRLLAGRTRVLTQPMQSLLTDTLRLNRHRTALYQQAAVRITGTLADAGVPSAVINGVAYDGVLYPAGTRRCTDLDLLVPADVLPTVAATMAAVGFTEPGRTATAHRHPTGDSLVPYLTVDVTTTLGHTDDPRAVRRALDHALRRRVTGGHLPVLTPGDALSHTLARAAARPRWHVLADALRLALEAPRESAPPASPGVLAGWNHVRGLWPDLPLLFPALPAAASHGRPT